MIKKIVFILLSFAAFFTAEAETTESKWDCHIYTAPVFGLNRINSKFKDISFKNYGFEFGVETVNTINKKVYKASADILRSVSNYKSQAGDLFTGVNYAVNLGFGYDFYLSEKSNLALLGIYQLNYVSIRCPAFRSGANSCSQQISIIENDIGLNLDYRLKLNSKFCLFDSLSLMYGLGGILNLSDNAAGTLSNYLWDCQKGGLGFNCALGIAYYF